MESETCLGMTVPGSESLSTYSQDFPSEKPDDRCLSQTLFTGSSTKKMNDRGQIL
jgi:hypothetical protein